MEAKIISQIDINVISPRDQFIDEYHNCPLCGTELDFVHVANFIEQEVIEEATCSHCKIRTKKETHSLQ